MPVYPAEDSNGDLPRQFAVPVYVVEFRRQLLERRLLKLL